MELERPRYDTSRDTTRQSNGTVEHNLGPAPLPPDFAAALRQQQQHQHQPAATSTSRQSESSDRQQQSANGIYTTGHSLERISTNGSAQDVASLELVTSLTATENSFIETLHSLIRRNFSSALRSQSGGGALINNASTGDDILRASTSTAADNERVSNDEDRSLQPLLQDLRVACTSLEEDPFAGAEMRQIIATSNDGASALQEIRTRLDYLTPYFPTTSEASSSSATNATAQAAKNLASMLAMIRRLQALYKASPSLASSHNHATPLPTPGIEGRFSFDLLAEDNKSVPEASQEVYSALHKQAKALQSASLSRQDSQDSTTNVVRAVEEAEVELLWGRMSDLLGNTMHVLKMDTSARTPVLKQSTTTQEYLFGATPALNNETGTFDNQNALPEYSSLEPPSYDSGDLQDGADEYTDTKDAMEGNAQTMSPRVRTATRGPTYPASDEKMQLDLDRMASAIERLYVSAPQLANQRVDAVHRNNESRQQVREMQLAKLGTAIERLCKGRMEDQRASLLQQQQSSSSNPFATARSRSKSKEQDMKKESLDKLLDEIDRAAARTLDGQRATMNGRQQEALNAARKTARLAAADLHIDKEEIAFKDYLMESAGKGRLTSQDASFTLGNPPASAGQSTFASKLAIKRRSLAHIFDEDPSASTSEGEKRNRIRSNSVGATPAPPMPAIPANFAGEKNGRPAIKKRFSVTRLLSSGKESATLLTAPGVRRSSKSSPSNSRPTSTYSPGLMQLTYTIEEMTNLGSMILQVWDSSANAEPQINPEPMSISLLDSRTVQVNQPDVQSALDESTRLHLTSEAQASLVSSKPLDLLYKADHYEIKIPTAVSTQFTRNRDDLEIAVPYSAQDFRKHQPRSLICASCSAQLAELSNVTRYNDLPSEHWAELLDAWMCHPDQTLSKDIIEKGNNIWPQANQALISTTGIVLATANTKGWVIAEELEPVHHSDGKWLIAKCKSCRALVGRSSPGPTRDINDKSAYVRFSKFAIQPASTSFMPICPLSLHVTATLLETSLARAIHRFVIEDEEEGNNQLILWVFNPYIRLFSNHPTFESSTPINAAKILYKAGKLADSDIVRLIGNAEHESLIYPRGVCHQLTELLQASTSVYPRSHQKLGEWDVGWLERDIGRRR